MDARENFLRAAEMEGPEWIPCRISLSPPIWHEYRNRIEVLVLNYPEIFGEYRKGSRDFDNFGIRHKGNTITDEWGCIWTFMIDGLHGQVVKHPLKDWGLLASYKPPDPVAMNAVTGEGVPCSLYSFNESKLRVEEAKIEGRLAAGDLPHGFMFQRLYYLRGFSNLMKDFILRPPQLKKLIDMVVGYNMKLIQRWLDIGVDLLIFGDDLGMQDRLAVNPKIFRRYLIPAFSKMFMKAREEGVHVFLHSDGHIMEIAEDLINAGVTILNLQDLVNGVDNIQKRLKGKVCIDLDIDRQKILPFGKPAKVKKHIHQVISALNSPEGGLMVTAGIYPPTPLENIKALFQALKESGCGLKL